MRIYTLAKRGISPSGGLEMIYKTSISVEEIEGAKIGDLERQVREDLREQIGLYDYAPVMIVTDGKDNTMSVVLREHNDKLCEIFRTEIRID